MIKKIITVNGMTCANCAKTIENTIMGMHPDVKVLVNVSAEKVILKYDENKYTLETFTKLIKMAGYKPVLENEIEQVKNNRRKMKLQIVVSVLISIPLLWSMLGHLNLFAGIFVPEIFKDGIFQMITAGIVQFVIGAKFYKGAYKSLRRKVLGMDILVVLGTTSAYVYSLYLLYVQLFVASQMHPVYYFEISAIIITMVLLGNYIESIVKEKTTNALSELANLGAKQARILKDGKELMIDIDKVEVNDLIVVYANEKIATDGEVVEGFSTVDESMFTGESLPVKKEKGSKVIGASVNLSQKLVIKAEKIGEDTLLNHIINTVEEVSSQKPPIQRMADKISSIFVPSVVTIAIINFVIWLIIGAGFTKAFETSIAILVISCPCALGLATPTSILVGNGLAAQNHILYKGGEFFERASKIDIICFDKTGTLTEGKPQVLNYEGNKEVLDIVYSVQKQSTHPISRAVVEYAQKHNAKEKNVTEFEEIKGKGISATVNQNKVLIGSIKLLDEYKIDYKDFKKTYFKLVNEVKTTNFVVVNNKVEAVYGVADKIKASSYHLIKKLKSINIKPVMITGDNKIVAAQIAKDLGIEEFYAEVLPHEKAKIVASLNKNGSIVAFVGDGINDAPALRVADVGIAVSNGSDIAINSSDITLMNHDLNIILNSISISKATLKNIKQNFFWAFSYNIVAIPLAATGNFNMALAAFAMSFSSIMVVLNALRLKRIKLSQNNIIKKEENTMKTIKVKDMSCNHCVMSIKKALNEANITDAKVDLDNKTVEVKVADEAVAYEQIKKAGYTPE